MIIFYPSVFLASDLYIGVFKMF